MNKKMKVAVLDDYQQVALSMADWSVLKDAEITVFSEHQSEQRDIVRRLLPFTVICVMRERTPLNRQLLTQLPGLKLIISTGRRNASIDVQAAEDLGIIVKSTGYLTSGAPEHTWALLMAMARHIPRENANFFSGKWQTTIGTDLKGKTIGIMGLGNIGSKIAEYARAFEMNVIAWSPNLMADKAMAMGARPVNKEDLFRIPDFITIHMVLSDRSRGIIQYEDLKLMKPTAFLINTSRGPLINERALIDILQQKKIAGAALDVFDIEPLPVDHPFRKMENLVATPHIGYVTQDTYRIFYQDTVKAIQEWLTAGRVEKKG
jgi:phosphoglycerate dehydrogenase-like enzyme